MSEISVAEVKRFLRVFHTADDVLLQALIDSAEDEACRFLNRTQLATLPLDYPSESSSEDVPSSNDDVAPSVRVAVYLLVQRMYEASKPEDSAKMRSAAEVLLFPYRTEIGV